MNISNVIKIRMERLGYMNPAQSEEDYDGLFRRLQPVSTEYFTEPGRPPSIRDRAAFDDTEYNRLLRGNQDLIKARFQGSTISYVRRDEIELYASAFCKPVSRMDDELVELYNILDQAGPMDKAQLMEEMDMKGPVVTKMLQKLQKAFLVYELQPDRFGEQVWQTFESEWPEFKLDRIPMEDARAEVVKRFIHNMVSVDMGMIADWTRFSKRDCRLLISRMLEKGMIDSFENGEDINYCLPGDKDTIFDMKSERVPESVFIIHKADYIYRAYESILKERFKGTEVLQFILIDGEFRGAVAGHWRIGPHDVEDIIVSLPKGEAERRESAVIDAVAKIYHPPNSSILRFNGKSL